MIRTGAAQKPNFCAGLFDLLRLGVEQRLAQAPLMGNEGPAGPAGLPYPVPSAFDVHPTSPGSATEMGKLGKEPAILDSASALVEHRHLGAGLVKFGSKKYRSKILRNIAL